MNSGNRGIEWRPANAQVIEYRQFNPSDRLPLRTDCPSAITHAGIRRNKGRPIAATVAGKRCGQESAGNARQEILIGCTNWGMPRHRLPAPEWHGGISGNKVRRAGTRRQNPAKVAVRMPFQNTTQSMNRFPAPSVHARPTDNRVMVIW